MKETQKALVAQYDAWSAREEEARREGTSWTIAMEARKKQSDEALAQIAALRRELIEEITRRKKRPS